MKRYVFMAIKTSEKGFTLYHILFVLTLLTICIPLQVSIIKSLQVESSLQEISVQQFFHLIQQDVIQSTNYNISNQQIFLELPNGDQASYEKYQNLLRRQVNNQGHEIYLREIDQFSLTVLPYGFTIHIQSIEGETYEKDIVFYP